MLAWIKASGFRETTYGRTLRTRQWKCIGGEKGNSLILALGSLPLSVSVSTRSLPGPINKVLSSSSSAAAAGKKWGTKVREGRDPILSPFYLGIGELGGGKNPAARSRRTDAFTKDSLFPDLFLPLFLLPF